MKLQHVVLNFRIPGFGAEFRVGHNCSGIDALDEGTVIADPRTERGELYEANILATSSGWGKVAPRESEPVTCELCGHVSANEQGHSAHLRFKHAKAAGKKGGK